MQIRFTLHVLSKGKGYWDLTAKNDIFEHSLHVCLLIFLPAVSVLVLLPSVTVVFCCAAKVTTGE